MSINIIKEKVIEINAIIIVVIVCCALSINIIAICINKFVFPIVLK